MPEAAQLTFLDTDLQELTALHTADVAPQFGSAVVSVPLNSFAGRGGLGPRFSLEYDSAARNSPFGTGWSLGGLLMISRETRRGLPRYDATDRYVFSGGGELVPVLIERQDGWQPRVEDAGAHWVAHYRARVETHVRIEHWTDKANGRVHWRSRDVRNVVTVYGLADGRIADPQDPARTFTWLPEAQYDPLGNAVVFEYAAEDLRGVDLGRSSERRR